MVIILGGLKLQRLLAFAKRAASIDGLVAECGIFNGDTLIAIARQLPHKRVLGFDTFAGLPAQHIRPDEPALQAGAFFASFDDVQRHTAVVPNIELIRGVFPASATAFEHERFAFVHLDMDLYQSTRDAIVWFRERMSPGGLVVFDDFNWHQCPGVKAAVAEAQLPVTSVPPHQAVWQA